MEYYHGFLEILLFDWNISMEMGNRRKFPLLYIDMSRGGWRQVKIDHTFIGQGGYGDGVIRSDISLRPLSHHYCAKG
jgi:hypothetical protein